jgi:hypothetical protein
MLAVMSNLASPMHGETTLTPALIAFYATVATVIPVLFIAVVVQGTTYMDVVRAARALGQWRAPRTGSHVGRVLGIVAEYSAAAVVQVLAVIIFLVLAAGGLGEFYAIYILYQGHDDISVRRTALFSVVFLIILVIVGPIVTFVRVGASGRASAESDKTDAG